MNHIHIIKHISYDTNHIIFDDAVDSIEFKFHPTSIKREKVYRGDYFGVRDNSFSMRLNKDGTITVMSGGHAAHSAYGPRKRIRWIPLGYWCGDTYHPL